VASENVFHLMRSKLFVPAVRPELFTKALSGDADAVCFDLEEGVPAERKAEARKLLSEFLHGLDSAVRPLLLVRVNPATSSDLPLDLEAVVHNSVSAISLPKVEEITDIQFVDTVLTKLERERGVVNSLNILVTIESPRGLRLAADLASSSSRIIGLQLGFADLLEPIGISSSDSTARNQIRLMIRLAAAEANVACYESAYPQFNDEQGFLAQLKDARALGFAGASCIHPKQIAAANEVFTPTAQEIEDAAGVVAAFEEAARKGNGVAQFKGKMIDRPFFLRARRIVSHNSSK
jgi:citrate lyase beta subunit